MRTIIILMFFILISCNKNIVPTKFENQMFITKKYVGELQKYYYVDKYTVIITDQIYFKVCGNISIPDSVSCYIRILPCYHDVHPYIAKQLEQQYFLFNNKEYRIKTW